MPRGRAGTPLEPLSVLKYNSADDAIVLPDDAWSQDKLLPCLAEVAVSEPGRLAEVPARADEGEQLLDEQSEPMEAGALHSTLERLMAYAEQVPGSMSSVVRTLITHAQFDGPFKLVGGPTATVDLATFNQHLSTIAACLNTLHDLWLPQTQPTHLAQALHHPFTAFPCNAKMPHPQIGYIPRFAEVEPSF